jgi:diacylglycerol kinase (ATP)
MASPFGTIRLIANPRAGRGKDAVLPQLRDALDARGLDHELALSTYAGHSVELARQAVEEDGIRFVVAVGGDGTVHEVVNGMVDPVSGPRATDLVLGVVPAGSGSDFARTFGLDASPEQLAARLDGGAVRTIDIGTVEVTGADGATRASCFANIAEVGYGAQVTEAAARYPRWVGSVRYLFAVFGVIRHFQRQPVQLRIDGQPMSAELCNVVVANCRYFGGNMHVAPDAEPDSGAFRVQLWPGRPRDVFLMTPKIKAGKHLGDPRMHFTTGSRIQVTSDDPILVEADGEVLGTTPVAFGLLPKALAVKI